jgi:hypothetical protein
VLSSHYPMLKDLTLSFCSYIDDSGLGYLTYCKKLTTLRLNFATVSSMGLLSDIEWLLYPEIALVMASILLQNRNFPNVIFGV